MTLKTKEHSKNKSKIEKMRLKKHTSQSHEHVVVSINVSIVKKIKDIMNYSILGVEPKPLDQRKSSDFIKIESLKLSLLYYTPIQC